MLRNNFGIYRKFFNCVYKEKCKTFRMMSNSTRAILANISRFRNNEIERYFYNNFKQKFNEKKNKYFNSYGRFLLGATIFSFAEDKITDEEIQDHFKEFYGEDNKTTTNDRPKDHYDPKIVQVDSTNVLYKKSIKYCDKILKTVCKNNFETDRSNTKLSADDPSNFIDSSWTQMIDSKSVKLWRRPLKSNAKLYEYRLCGTFSDISAKDFFFVQTNIEYRKSWDDLVVDLRILYTDDTTKTETIRWITHYPYPMRDREYIFKRRSIRNELQETAIIISKSFSSDNPLKLESSNSQNIKVHDYKSVMYIQAHKKFDQHGIDYFLIYYDNPKTSFPNAAVSWMSTAGIPSFMDKVHKAALKLEQDRNTTEDVRYEESSNIVEDENVTESTIRDVNNDSFSSYFSAALLLLRFNKTKTENTLYNVQKSQ